MAALGYQVYAGEQARRAQKDQLNAIAGQKAPVATPAPAPTDNNPENTASARLKKLSAMQYGFASTISNMSPMNPTGLKTKTGQ